MSKFTCFALICLCTFIPNLLVSQESQDQAKCWQLEISAGAMMFADTDLSLFAQAEEAYLSLYFRHNPSYQTQTDLTLTDFNILYTGLAKLKYRLNKRLSIGMGLQYLSGGSSQEGSATFLRDQSWRVLEDSLDYQPFASDLSLLFPSLGSSLRFPLSKKLQFELGLSVGPVFAKATLTRNIMDRIEAREINPPNEYLLYQGTRNLTMSGSGIGFGLGGDLALQLQMSQNFGLQLTTSYTYFYIPNVDGSSTFNAGAEAKQWNGTWFISGERVEKYWGSGEFRYPSNDPNLLNRKVRDFTLNINGFCSLLLGIYITF